MARWRKTMTLLPGLFAGLVLGGLIAVPARAVEPIKIGFGMGLTGGLAANGKAALLAMKIWEDETNSEGGLLGRPVKLIYYDDQSNPATVPGIFTKLLDVDKVDLVCGDYGTNLLAPAMPVVIQHNMTFFALFGLDVNREFQYPKYFAMQPAGGPEPAVSFSQGFFAVAAAQSPKPKTLAIIAGDAEFPRNAADGARKNAKAAGLDIVYDKTYPPTTADFTPIVRAIDATNPDVVFSASYPPDAVGIVRTVNEIGIKAKLFGGGLVGLQYASIKQQLGPQLNGIVNYDFWEPAKTLQFPGVEQFLKKIPSQGGERRGRPAGLLPAALCLCQSAGARSSGRGHQEPRPGQARRLPAPEHAEDDRRRHQVWPERRMGAGTRPPGAVSRRKGQRPRSVERHRHPDDRVAGAIRDRQGALPLRRRQEVAPAFAREEGVVSRSTEREGHHALWHRTTGYAQGGSALSDRA